MVSIFSGVYWPFVCFLWENIHSDPLPSFVLGRPLICPLEGVLNIFINQVNKRTHRGMEPGDQALKFPASETAKTRPSLRERRHSFRVLLAVTAATSIQIGLHGEPVPRLWGVMATDVQVQPGCREGGAWKSGEPRAHPLGLLLHLRMGSFSSSGKTEVSFCAARLTRRTGRLQHKQRFQFQLSFLSVPNASPRKGHCDWKSVDKVPAPGAPGRGSRHTQRKPGCPEPRPVRDGAGGGGAIRHGDFFNFVLDPVPKYWKVI